MRFLVFLALLILLELLELKTGLACDALPWVKSDTLPACPEVGSSKILPETYPALAVIIPWGESGDTRLLSLDLIYETIRAAGEQLPLIVLAGLNNRHEIQSLEQEIPHLVDHLKNEGHFPHQTKEDLAAQLKKIFVFDSGSKNLQGEVVNHGWGWQQDYFKATYDSENGFPLLHAIQGYNAFGFPSSHVMTSSLSDSMSRVCEGIKYSTLIPPHLEAHFRAPSASYGGNSLGLPGGLYLTGNNQSWEKVGKHYAGVESDSIRISTVWLNTDHVDEIVNVVRDRSRAAPCHFALSIASPNRALEVLSEDKNKNEPFFGFRSRNEGLKRHPLGRLQNSPLSDYLDRMSSPSVEAVCTAVNEYRKKKMESAASRNWTQPGLSYYRDLVRSLFSPLDSRPMTGFMGMMSDLSFQGSSLCRPLSLTNGEVAEAIKGGALGRFNSLIQAEMDKNEAEILSKLKARTGCESLRTVHVPDLFFSSHPEEALHHGYGLSEHDAFSILPNPTNSLLVADTVILSDPQNAAFLTEIESRYQELGLKTRPVESWVKHISLGNIHCSTNTLRICKPSARRE